MQNMKPHQTTDFTPYQVKQQQKNQEFLQTLKIHLQKLQQTRTYGNTETESKTRKTSNTY